MIKVKAIWKKGKRQTFEVSIRVEITKNKYLFEFQSFENFKVNNSRAFV